MLGWGLSDAVLAASSIDTISPSRFAFLCLRKQSSARLTALPAVDW